MTELPLSHPLRLSDLRRSGGSEVDLQPDAEARAAIAEMLEISGIRKLRLTGRLSPEGRDDWRLDGALGATVVQPCVATLAPVITRIDEPVRRRWVKDMPQPTGDEIEMPDDEVEQLGHVIDLGAVLIEALALALPPWPRAEGASEAVQEPDEETQRPFSGLGALRDRLADRGPQDEAGNATSAGKGRDREQEKE